MTHAARVTRPSPLPGVRADPGPSRPSAVARVVSLQSACGNRAFAQIVAAQIQRSPDEPWTQQSLWEGELGTTAKKNPVKAFYFPGTTTRRALVIAGVHGSERQGIEVANLLMVALKATPPAFSVMLVPTLFSDHAAAGTHGIREGGTPTNRNFPTPDDKQAEARSADEDLSLRAAKMIDAATAGVTGRESRGMVREGEGAVPKDQAGPRSAHSSVAGNVGKSGDLDTAFWAGSTPGGVSLGGYASARGMSVFTVEPPVNRNLADYGKGGNRAGDKVTQAGRTVELQAYADAVRTVLLGL